MRLPLRFVLLAGFLAVLGTSAGKRERAKRRSIKRHTGGATGSAGSPSDIADCQFGLDFLTVDERSSALSRVWCATSKQRSTDGLLENGNRPCYRVESRYESCFPLSLRQCLRRVIVLGLAHQHATPRLMMCDCHAVIVSLCDCHALSWALLLPTIVAYRGQR